MKIKTLCLLALCLLAASVSASPIYVQLSGAYAYAPVTGFAQIPLGGQPSTSSVKQPSFSSVGIKHANLGDFQLDLTHNAWGAFLNYQIQQPSGHAVLQQNLITHGVLFPAGTAVNASFKFNLLTGGVYYNFIHQQWTFRPIIAASGLDFDDKLTSAMQTTKRSFTQATPRVGLDVIYQLNPKFAVSLAGLSSIPSLTNLGVYSAELKGNYTIFQNIHYALNGFAGAGYQQIHFKDRQTMPNNIRLTDWPMLFAGLGVKF